MDSWLLFWDQLPQQLINSLWLGGVYALFALGYTLVFGVIKELNLAHGSIFMWGSFIGLICVTIFKLPVIIALPIAMLLAGACGILLERLAYKPLRRLGSGTAILWSGFILFLIANFRILPDLGNWIIGGIGVVIMISGLVRGYLGKHPGKLRERDPLAPLISSIGAGSIMVSLSQATFGAQQSRFPQGTFPHIILRIGPVSITLLQLIIFILSLLLMGGLTWFVFYSNLV